MSQDGDTCYEEAFSSFLAGVFLTRKMHKPVSTSDMINSTIKKFFCFSVIMIPPYAVISLNI